MVNKGGAASSDDNKKGSLDGGLPAERPPPAIAIQQRIPTIRLKLKVKSEGAGDKAGEPSVKQQESLEPVGDKGLPELVNESDSRLPEPVTEPVSEIRLPSESRLPEPSSPAANPANPASSPSLCGTFKYRPFKLFPLLPPSSRYRVLVPRPYASPRHNPAFPLNYLWRGEEEGVYTDDSDLVCVAVREGWCGGGGEGKEMMIEVEVVGKQNPSQLSRVERPPPPQGSVDAAAPSPSSPPTPRLYPSPHDGHHIRILSVTLNPSAVHLKRWRKHKRARCSGGRGASEERILTPKFKTGSGGD